MDLRPFQSADLEPLLALTIETFGPFYADFREHLGDSIFTHQHGHWRDDYRHQLSALHDPEAGKLVTIADTGGEIAGYVAWNVDLERGHGEIDILAVAADHRGHRLGTSLCEHAFAGMRSRGVGVVEIGTGGDPFHKPARALYESLGCTALPLAVFFKQL